MRQLKSRAALLLVLLWCALLCACGPHSAEQAPSLSLEDVPAFSGEPYVELNGNQPDFSQEEGTDQSYETYSPLDSLGRCGTAQACVGVDIMPTQERGDIGQVKPTGWHTVKYDQVDGKYLYNRCHLIGYQLTGENANEKNLITGTRYLNMEGMLPFENLVADYVKETENHVLYRVTPIFQGDDLLARGVQMEAWSVEDQGDGVCFNVYCYNSQPGITIDYATGESWLEEDANSSSGQGEGSQSASPEEEGTYVLNTSSKKFHLPDCSGVSSMSPANRQDYTGSRQDLLSQGYSPCGTCKPRSPASPPSPAHSAAKRLMSEVFRKVKRPPSESSEGGRFLFYIRYPLTPGEGRLCVGCGCRTARPEPRRSSPPAPSRPGPARSFPR